MESRTTGARKLPFFSNAVAQAVAGAPSTTDLKEVIDLLIGRQDLSAEQTEAAMEALLTGAEPTQIAAFLVLLRAKGETPDEVAGLARAMRSRCVPVPSLSNPDLNIPLVDIVGTGGDGANTVNISTGACIIAAAAGANVAKHGNRSVSSMCGSADVLEALGVEVDIGPESVSRCVIETGMGFFYAPRFHPAMRIVSPVRKSLKVRTAFNLLGPMLNPAQTPYGLIGVFNDQMVELMAQSLQRLGIKRALVVHSKGLDEISPMGPADLWEVTPTSVQSFHFDPIDAGIQRCTVEDLRGGDAKYNAAVLRETFEGKRGPVADAMILNAGAALYACALSSSVGEGVAMAAEAHQQGKAIKVMDKWASLTQALKAQELSNTPSS